MNVVEVDDCRSPVTVFSFAGLNVDRQKTPAFEFRNFLRTHCAGYNRVFLRDPHHLLYHVTPEGQPGGLDFYAAEVDRLLALLGSTYNVAIGCSMGAMAALYFGARCRLNQVIAFGTVFPTPEFGSPWPVVQAWCNVPLAVRSPVSYLGDIFLKSALRGRYRGVRRVVGEGGIRRFWDEYRRPGPLPRVTLYYAARMPLERQHAELLASCCPIEAIGLPTVNHNTPGYLKKRGELAGAILGRIEAGLTQHCGSSLSAGPP